MDQKITVKVADQEFHLKASSQEVESDIRFAADEVNKMMAQFDQKYPNNSFIEKLTLVALSQAMFKLQTQKKVEILEKESKNLESRLSSYLEGLEIDR